MGGESFFVNTFTAGNFGGWVSISPPSPGDIHSQDLRPGENLFLQGSSFLACTENVQTDTQFQGLKGVFSGESIFFLRAFAQGAGGTVFFRFLRGHQAAGTVDSGEELVVDTGHVVAFTDGVEYSIGKVGGMRSLLVGGEGLVMKFRGRGQVWIQRAGTSRAWAHRLMPFLGKKGG